MCIYGSCRQSLGKSAGVLVKEILAVVTDKPSKSQRLSAAHVYFTCETYSPGSSLDVGEGPHRESGCQVFRLLRLTAEVTLVCQQTVRRTGKRGWVCITVSWDSHKLPQT